jgi:hypothetical protein
MRRNLALSVPGILAVLGACLLVVAPGTAAFAGGSTYYSGKNSQGQKMLFTVDQTASGPKFDPIFINQVSRCPATGDVFTVEFSFSGFQVPIKNGKFNFALNDLSDLLRWTGTVNSKGASGKESIDMAGFDREGGLQDCGAGSLSWKAQALHPGSPTTAPGADYLIKVTKAANGSAHFSITHR